MGTGSMHLGAWKGAVCRPLPRSRPAQGKYAPLCLAVGLQASAQKGADTCSVLSPEFARVGPGHWQRMPVLRAGLGPVGFLGPLVMESDLASMNGVCT